MTQQVKPTFDIKVDCEKAKKIPNYICFMTSNGRGMFSRKKYFSRKDTLELINFKRKGGVIL